MRADHSRPTARPIERCPLPPPPLDLPFLPLNTAGASDGARIPHHPLSYVRPEQRPSPRFSGTGPDRRVRRGEGKKRKKEGKKCSARAPHAARVKACEKGARRERARDLFGPRRARLRAQLRQVRTSMHKRMESRISSQLGGYMVRSKWRGDVWTHPPRESADPTPPSRVLEVELPVRVQTGWPPPGHKHLSEDRVQSPASSERKGANEGGPREE